ncbi:tetratricopeptide repeat protein [Microcoleus sp. FACHB-53]|nr:tetratricopeptide repeat protein [Microcoleus sp. FACHB-53]
MGADGIRYGCDCCCCGVVWGVGGVIYANQGKVEQALDLYQQVLETAESIGDVRGKAAALANLGQLLADEKGDFDKALDYLLQSLEILQRLQSPDTETVREALARVQQMRDDIQ